MVQHKLKGLIYKLRESIKKEEKIKTNEIVKYFIFRTFLGTITLQNLKISRIFTQLNKRQNYLNFIAISKNGRINVYFHKCLQQNRDNVLPEKNETTNCSPPTLSLVLPVACVFV